MIRLLTGDEFDPADLELHLRTMPREEIVIGKKNCTLAEHPEPKSLDCWLRGRFPANQDTRLIDDAALDGLVATGRFLRVRIASPVTGRLVNGLKLAPAKR